MFRFFHITMDLKQKYKKIEKADLEFFRKVLGERCYVDEESLLKYAHDETEDLSFPPDVVLKPETTEEVSQIMAYCSEHTICVSPCGARTGLSGGSLPVFGGVALSMERFKRILAIDEDNLQVIVEPGVIVEDLQNAVKEKGLFYPPDPSSKGSCFIGGNVAENSGGPKAVKYGVTKDYVLNLEIVMPNGHVMFTGANVLKNSTGYNLTQLITGSEGTLAIITKIVLRLISHPSHDLLMLVPFFDAKQACAAVAAIFKAGITPSGLEFMERDALLWTQEYTNDYTIKVAPNHAAHLLIEVDGFNPDQLLQDCEKIISVLENFEADEVLFAESEAQKNALWSLRRKVGEAVKTQSIYKEEDTVVPRYFLPELLDFVKKTGAEYGFKSICYGHAGDGNLHINIIRGDLSEEFWQNGLTLAIRKIFERVKELGGTISGEHGIGLVQKSYMDIVFDQQAIDLQKKIKQIFDPKGILNPGKIFE